MALFKSLRGKRENLPSTKTDGYAYFCVDDGTFWIDYKDQNGVVQRKQLNAKDAETLMGASLSTILNDSEVEIPTSKAVLDAINSIDIPTKTSDLTNDSDFATNNSVNAALSTKLALTNLTNLSVSDLDKLLAPGVYCTSMAGAANMISNCPVRMEKFIICVYHNRAYDSSIYPVEVIQELKPLSDSSYKYVRIGTIASATATTATFKSWNVVKYYSQTTSTVTLSSTWTGTESPYSQQVTIDGVTENSKVDLNPSGEQLNSLAANRTILNTANDNGTVTVYAIGNKPTESYTMQATITEV